MIDPIEGHAAWAVVRLGQVLSPGLAQVSGFKRTSDWDQKKGKGSLGATLTYTGRPAAEGSIKFILWERPTHFVAWEAFSRLLQSDPTKTKVQAVDIYHPALAQLGINSVVTKTMGLVEHEGKGLYSVVVEMIEYFPPPQKSAVKTPDGSKSNAGKTPGSSPSGDPIADAKQAEIARLLAEAKKP